MWATSVHRSPSFPQQQHAHKMLLLAFVTTDAAVRKCDGVAEPRPEQNMTEAALTAPHMTDVRMRGIRKHKKRTAWACVTAHLLLGEWARCATICCRLRDGPRLRLGSGATRDRAVTPRVPRAHLAIHGAAAHLGGAAGRITCGHQLPAGVVAVVCTPQIGAATGAGLTFCGANRTS